MNVKITSRKLTLDDGFKARAEKKLNKLDKFFPGEADATIKVATEKNKESVELTIIYSGMIFRGECVDEKKEASLDKVIDVIIRQIRKNKTKLEKRLKTECIKDIPLAVNESPVEEELTFTVEREKKFTVKPMLPDEAILQMNMLEHNFYIFLNGETGDMNVAYKRKNGGYGILVPQIK